LHPHSGILLTFGRIFLGWRFESRGVAIRTSSFHFIASAEISPGFLALSATSNSRTCPQKKIKRINQFDSTARTWSQKKSFNLHIPKHQMQSKIASENGLIGRWLSPWIIGGNNSKSRSIQPTWRTSTPCTASTSVQCAARTSAACGWQETSANSRLSKKISEEQALGVGLEQKAKLFNEKGA